MEIGLEAFGPAGGGDGACELWRTWRRLAASVAGMAGL
jgi:hypothetical protein